MNASRPAGTPVAQGFAADRSERIGLPAPEAMDAAQRKAVDDLVNGPRKGVKGPFVPLMQCPELLDRVARLGEYLRFQSGLEARVRELVTALVARSVGNQFEWAVHRPLAEQAGVASVVMEAIAAGARPVAMPADEALAHDFTVELLAHHGVCDATYARAKSQWGERGIVELTTLIGYFACVSWLMNVARTPGPAAPGGELGAFPS